MRVRVASAGTGKTTSLVRRFLEAIAAGEPLRRLAGVTFTRNAAAELRERVGEGIGDLLRDGEYLGGLVVLDEGARPRFEEARRELDGATLTTIHGFMALGLRLSAPLLGLDPDVATLPEWEAQAMFEEELGGVLLVAAAEDHPLHAPVSRLGDRLVPLATEVFRRRSLAEGLEPGPADEAARDLLALYGEAYRRFQARLGAGRLSPAEIERMALRLVRSPQALARLAARAPHVVVDEFQDVNPLQGRFFAALERGGVRVEVVGDPKQSIYGFRQADVGVFREALRTGEVLEPLTLSRRHAQVPVRFLNRLTQELGARGWGFSSEEAPAVQGAGPQAEVRGRVEVHWVRGSAPLAELRLREAEVLAGRLALAHEERGVPYAEMAVLARSHRGLETVGAALEARGIPSVLLQGRGYYERSEIRDLVHALRVGIEPAGVALAAWLRGPFGGLPPADIDAVLRDEDPPARLKADHPDVWERLARIRSAVRDTPLQALRALVRAPMIDGKRFVDLLSRRERENVDALTFSLAEGPPAGLEVLLERLDLLSRQGDAGEMPQAGEGVALLTVHGSKGLEWRCTAVFDLGGGGSGRPEPLYLEDGRLHLPGGAGFAAARAAANERARQESYRLLYVAASRCRDELILTGSVTDRGPEGWARALEVMDLGPLEREREGPSLVLAVHAARRGEVHERVPVRPADPGLAEAPWTRRRFGPGPFPPVESPSRVRRVRVPGEEGGDGNASVVAAGPPASSAGGGEGVTRDRHAVTPGWRASTPPGPPPSTSAADDEGEPLPPSDPAEGERLPGQAVTVGTLLHDAIRRDASPDDGEEIDLLRAQEVMFPYTPEEQDRLLDEVRAMLGTYRDMLGGVLPALGDRERDLREWPVVLPDGRQVWQGVIDRLYLVEGRWFLDDYKTDRTLRPARYAFQLAVYREAVRSVLRVEPTVRLVGLRDGTVLPYDGRDLDEAWEARSRLRTSEGVP